jgi:hypothetical protein
MSQLDEKSSFLTDEKSPLIDIEQQHEPQPGRRSPWRWLPWVSLLFYLIITPYIFSGVSLFPWPYPGEEIIEPKETFELRLPILYENLVHEETLIQYSFGNSWGTPAQGWFIPPLKEKEFNRVVLEMNTTVDGVQYDRLAHIFIDDIPVWRTSTAEPGNELVFTSVKKDISKYLSLFDARNTSVTLQLDNLIRGKLTGAFNTTLTVRYYLEDDTDNDIFNHMTVTNHPAERVSKLIDAKPNRTPLLYYPNDKLQFSIPKVGRNTTALKLALFVSGNAEEEFWYSNCIESRKSHFTHFGHPLLGHGPVRLISVYVNNKLISVNAPEPVIFSGGVSPALWKPIIGVNALDVKAIEIDLTAMIPELWKTSAALDVVITNGTDSGTVGQNWIVSGSLLHWEHDQIEWSYGAIESYDNSTQLVVVDKATDPEKMFQMIQSSATTEIKSNFTLILKNGTEIPVKLHCQSRAKFADAQQYYRYGDLQLVSSTVSSSHSTNLKIGDLKTNVKSIKFYPLVLSIDTEPIIPPNVTYVANVTNVYGSRVLIDDREVYILESYQNGTSEFTLSPKGNHGFGSTDQTFGADMKKPFSKFREDAQAKAVNGTVIERDEKTWYDEASVQLSVDEQDVVGLHLQELVRDGSMSFAVASMFLQQLDEYRDAVYAQAQKLRTSTEENLYFRGLRILDG